MKLKKRFITQDYHGEQLMVAIGPESRTFHGIVRSNETAAFIVNQLKRETSEDAIVRAIIEVYDTDEARAAAGVRMVLEKLRGIGALEE